MKKPQKDVDSAPHPAQGGSAGKPQGATPDTSREATEAARPFGALLHRLGQRLHEELERTLVPLHLAPQHDFVLFNLSRYGPRSQLSLGGCAAINRTTMVSLVDHLESLGLVQRRRDPNDRRAYIIHLTEKGAATLERAMVLHREAEARCLRPLSSSEQKLLRDLLVRLIPPSEGPGA
jgi:DNA-binding MarR family transcriptional regulator